MPVRDAADSADVEQRIAAFFAAPAIQRAERLRQLFVEKLDFQPARQSLPLRPVAQGTYLPPNAELVGRLQGVTAAFVPLHIAETDRVRRLEIDAASNLLQNQLAGDILLVFANTSGSQLHFVYPTFKAARPTLRRMVIERDLPRRTAVHQLASIWHRWMDSRDIVLALNAAFDVEAVTGAFFAEYRRVFDAAMGMVRGFGASSQQQAAKRLFVQTLFNRLMFVYFLSRKGWLKFPGYEEPNDYLNGLWHSYQKARQDPQQSEQKNFYEHRLKLLFFTGLNNERSADLIRNNPAIYALIGDVPFLNGGLFDRSDIDKRSDIEVPDPAIDLLLRNRPGDYGLLNRFNFTVMESTPFDIEVAVDPEMLGKVFEELITQRHESGAYYTPRPVVSFMCREALKGFLTGQEGEGSAEAIRKFVDEKDPSLIDLSAAPRIGEALQQVTVVDPACGSGAYLLGMLHELVELQEVLYSSRLGHDPEQLYEMKLRIIERSLYGSDIDPFAVNIAMLRLLLSLSVDYEGVVPRPIPNLDFKIVCGDSLTGPNPNPERTTTLLRHRIHELASELPGLKARHIRATGDGKLTLGAKIQNVERDLSAALSDDPAPDGAVDWRVQFAEVFDARGGFDIAIANPPYVRHQLIPKDYKRSLVESYDRAGTGQSDLFVFFYARALQLLRHGGMHVFVCSNSWLDADYGEHLQKYLVNRASLLIILDSEIERQFSTAAINTIVSVLRKGTQPNVKTRFANLLAPFDIAIGDLDGDDVKRAEDPLGIEESALHESAGRYHVRKSERIRQRSVVLDEPRMDGPNIGKWGGLYLRAPSVWDDVVALAASVLVPASKEFSVDTYLILPRKADQVIVFRREEAPADIQRYLVPFVRSPRYFARPLITSSDHLILKCSVADRRNDVALNKFLRDAEQRLYEDFAVDELKNDWFVVDQTPCDILWQRRFGNRHLVLLNPKGFLSYDFYRSNYRKTRTGDFIPRAAASFLNTFTWLGKEIYGRVNLGEGALKVESSDIGRIPIVPLSEIPASAIEAASELMRRECLDLDAELITDDRRAMDNAIADRIGVTSAQLSRVYEAVRALVVRRTVKAASAD